MSGLPSPLVYLWNCHIFMNSVILKWIVLFCNYSAINNLKQDFFSLIISNLIVIVCAFLSMLLSVCLFVLSLFALGLFIASHIESLDERKVRNRTLSPSYILYNAISKCHHVYVCTFLTMLKQIRLFTLL